MYQNTANLDAMPICSFPSKTRPRNPLFSGVFDADYSLSRTARSTLRIIEGLRPVARV